MHYKAYELLKSFLERNETGELPIPVEYALLNMLHGTGQAVKLIREIAHTSRKQAYHTLSIMEARRYPFDLCKLRHEVHLIEDELEAQTLAASCDVEALEAHIALWALLPPETEASQRRHRVLALALEINAPVRAAAFIRGFTPVYESVEFWKAFRRRLLLRVKPLAPEAAVPLIDQADDADSWLQELLVQSGSNSQELLFLLMSRMVELRLPLHLPLSETQRLLDAVTRNGVLKVTDLLCLMTHLGGRPVSERTSLLLQLMEVGRGLPDGELTRLLEAVRDNSIPYLPLTERREVLRRLVHLARHCSPEIRQELRVLRAMALLVHLTAHRLERAEAWAHAYDTRFHKRLEVVQKERARLLLQATNLLKRRKEKELTS